MKAAPRPTAVDDDVVAGRLKLSDLSGLSKEDTLKAWRVRGGGIAGVPNGESAGGDLEDAERRRPRYSSSEATAAGLLEAAGGGGKACDDDDWGRKDDVPCGTQGRSQRGHRGRRETEDGTWAAADAGAAAGAGAAADFNRCESDVRDEVKDSLCDLPPNGFWRRQSSRESGNLSRESSDGSRGADRLHTHEGLGAQGRPERRRSHEGFGSPGRRLSGESCLGSPGRRLSFASMWLDQSTCSFSEDEEDYEMADGQVALTP